MAKGLKDAPPPASKPGVPLVRALDRGIALLKSFTPAKPRLTLAELSRAADLDRGTARRLLQTLVLGGLVQHDEHAGHYALGIGVLELSSAVETGRSLREVAEPYLLDLANQTACVAFLWACHDGLALCLDRAKPQIPGIEATWFAVGARAPLNTGGGAKAMLAFLPEEEREKALSIPPLKRTPASVTSPAALRAEVARIRKQGWALAVDDFVIGLTGLGVPILTPRGQLLGALSLSGITSLFTATAAPPHIGLLQKAAAKIGASVS